MKTLYVNARYLIVPVMTVITIIGLYFGGIYAWIGAYLFVINTIIDTLTKDIHLRADFDNEGNSYGIKAFQYSVMYLMLPTFVVLQVLLAYNLYQFVTLGTISSVELIGATLSCGLWAGLGIIYGHELSHNKKEQYPVPR